MNQLEVLEPNLIEEAVELLDPEDPSVRPIAGGTALMLMMKSKVYNPTRLVSLRKVQSQYSGISEEANGDLKIGAMTTLRDIEKSALVNSCNPVITEALRTLSNVRIRNVATLGGHLAHGDPHMDLPPILQALGAYVHTIHREGVRTVSLYDLFAGYYQTTLGRNELITDVVIPKLPTGTQGSYVKCTSLSMDDWPTVGVAVFFRQEDGVLVDSKVSVSAALEKPTRFEKIENFLLGKEASRELFKEAADIAAEDVRTLADIRGTAAYKKEMVRVYVRRALDKALKSVPYQGRD